MSGPTIVIIEDDPDVTEIAQRHLERSLDASVHVFAEGSKALRYLSEAGPPDLVLLDLSLPDISGFEVCYTLRASDRLRAVPVLVLSARGGLDDQARADEVGVDGYLVKPVRARSFIAEVARMIREGRGAA